VSALETVTAFFDQELRLEFLAPDVEFRPLTGQVFFGREGFAAALDDIAQQFRDYDVAPVELTAAGDELVLVALQRTGVTHRGDVPVTDTFAQIFTVRDRVIVRIESFKTLGEARQAIA
jgi:ketosteroid isomerase-like protein